MEANQTKEISIKKYNNPIFWAKVALVIITLNIARQLAAIYQVQHELNSPLIPKAIIWDMQKQFIFKASVFASVTSIALILYYFKKHIYVIILVAITLIISRYIYLPLGF